MEVEEWERRGGVEGCRSGKVEGWRSEKVEEWRSVEVEGGGVDESVEE